MSDHPHFVDEDMRQAIRARIVELYGDHGLAAFQFPGVQQAIALLVDADPTTRLSPAKLAEIYKKSMAAFRASRFRK